MPTIRLDNGRHVTDRSLICRGEKCDDKFRITIDTRHDTGNRDQEIEVLRTAGAMLGWRGVEWRTGDAVADANVVPILDYCPFCSSKLSLLCARCRFRECACVGGPRFLAVRP